MPSLTQRLQRLLMAELHHGLDQAEQPERMLGQALRELDEIIATVRHGLAAALAGRRGLEAQLEAQQAAVVKRAAQAEQALAQGREDLARDLLERKLLLQARVEAGQSAVDRARQEDRALEAKLQRLEERRHHTARRYRELLQRRRSTQARQGLNRALGRFADGTREPPLALFERMEQRICQEAAEAKSLGELLDWAGETGQERDEDSLDRRVRETAVEQELAALRARLDEQGRGGA